MGSKAERYNECNLQNFECIVCQYYCWKAMCIFPWTISVLTFPEKKLPLRFEMSMSVCVIINLWSNKIVKKQLSVLILRTIKTMNQHGYGNILNWNWKKNVHLKRNLTTEEKKQKKGNSFIEDTNVAFNCYNCE